MQQQLHEVAAMLSCEQEQSPVSAKQNDGNSNAKIAVSIVVLRNMSCTRLSKANRGDIAEV